MKSFLNKGTLLMIMVLLCNRDYLFGQVPFSTQPEKTQTRSGNREFQKQNFPEAEASYKKALDIKNNMPEATFNLGDAVYEQKRFDDAQKQFQLSAKTNTDPNLRAKAFHNLGNTYLEQKKYEDAIKAYKDALRINPQDGDTKYNLAYANAMLQKNNGGGGDKNKQDQQKKDQQNKDQQDKDQQDKDQQNKDQQNKDQQANNQDKQQQQQQNPRLSKEEADRLLAALANEEQKANEKMQKQQMKAVKIKTRKDW